MSKFDEQDGHEQDCPNRPLRVGDYVRWDHFMVSKHIWIEGVLTYIAREASFESPGKRIVRIDVARSNCFALGSERSVLYGEGITLRRVDCGVSDATPAPGPVLHDGLTAEQCLANWQACQREEPGHVVVWPTPPQLAAARELWSAQLRAKRDAAKEKERCAVTYCDVDVDD